MLRRKRKDRVELCSINIPAKDIRMVFVFTGILAETNTLTISYYILHIKNVKLTFFDSFTTMSTRPIASERTI